MYQVLPMEAEGMLEENTSLFFEARKVVVCRSGLWNWVVAAARMKRFEGEWSAGMGLYKCDSPRSEAFIP
jgi:hypothetical protein